MDRNRYKKCGFDELIEALLTIDCIIAIGMFLAGVILKELGYIFGITGIIFSIGVLIWIRVERAHRHEIRAKLRKKIRNDDKRR